VFEPAMWAVFIVLLIAVGFAWWFKGYAQKVQDQTGKTYPVFWISLAAIVLGPALVYFLVGQPMNPDYAVLKGFNLKGGLVIRPPFIALTLALSIYTAAFIAAIVRAGIQAISHGQTEAA